MITVTLENFEQAKEIIKILAEQEYEFEVQLVNEKPIKAKSGKQHGAILKQMLANLNK